ncbi:MAG: LPS export ABC transporter periplasmic protein LptC [Gammaproteobacteria bacterium]|nr:MAG: LPS export ABC transporter periplasmic protein LptC [Gammaproteobacteria bacterium]
MAYKNTFITLSFTLIVGLAAWTTFMSYRPQTPNAAPPSNLPDAYMEDVVAVIMDKEGKPKMKIVTPKMVHYGENDTTQLTSPELTLYRQSPQPWHITSRYAKAMEGTDIVDFWDNVMILHTADKNNPATVVKTTALTVYPNKQTAETKEFITLEQPHLLVKAVGMQADMNTGDIKLLSQTRGEYVSDS